LNNSDQVQHFGLWRASVKTPRDHRPLLGTHFDAVAVGFRAYMQALMITVIVNIRLTNIWHQTIQETRPGYGNNPAWWTGVS